MGHVMELNPHETVDCGLLFHPQLYDYNEIAYLKKNCAEGDVFFDVGANIGFYSLMASDLVGESGRVVAVEADPAVFQSLRGNIRRNNVANVTAVNNGASSENEVLELCLNTEGNSGGNTFLPDHSAPDARTVPVACKPLAEIQRAVGVRKIDGMKIDIEGMEFRVLKKYFETISVDLYPKFIIIEHNPEWNQKAGGDAVDLLSLNGYRIHKKTHYNYIMAFSGTGEEMS
ncbi:MAG: FkbM family methyltransferase [Lentisphaeria bacterium]|nr:FkbM family methyltransferase [Lentisphaeria bacterium]